MLSLLFAVAAATPVPTQSWERALDVEAQHMTILGTWALGNLAVGTAGALAADEPRWQAFHGTNAAWNTVNLAIAGTGLLGVRRRRARGLPTPDAVEKAHRGLRTALAVNVGLDVVYMAAGAGLLASDGSTQGVDHRGVGAGLLLQGAFLATFDLAFLRAHRQVDAPSWTLAPVPVGDGIALGLAATWGRR